MMDIFLIFIVLFSIFFSYKIIFDTKDVCYFAPSAKTDNGKMVQAANKVSVFNWPSYMHSIPGNRGQLREYWVLSLSILGKIKKDNFSDHMNVTLALLSNAISIVLIYFIFSNYFGDNVAIIVTLMYATSFWPYHVAIFMGHIHLSQMFFLLSVIFIQNYSSLSVTYSLSMIFFAGVFVAMSFFSSSASRKYPPMALVALIFEFRSELIELPLLNIYSFESILILTVLLLIILFKIFSSYYPENTRLFFVRLTGLDKLKNHHNLFQLIF